VVNTGSPVIALTGGSGFLGSHIADALLAAGHRVRVAVRPTSNLRWLADKPVETVLVDFDQAETCTAFLTGTVGLIHCAGVVTAPDEAGYRQANVSSTIRLLAAAERAWADTPDVTFLFISSLAAHGPAPLSQPARENDPDRPLTAYGRSKLLAETAVMANAGSFRRVILRPPSLYGPRDREFLPLLQAAIKGWTIRPGHLMTGLSLVDGRDAAAAAVALLSAPATNGVYYVSDRHIGYDWDEIQAALEAAAGRDLKRRDIPLLLIRSAAALAQAWRRITGSQAALLLTRDRAQDLAASGWVCDGSRLTRDTGFSARCDATVGFTETLAFYRKCGWL
jgi:nucleoside-diphosphate-sugar epimerase